MLILFYHNTMQLLISKGKLLLSTFFYYASVISISSRWNHPLLTIWFLMMYIAKMSHFNNKMNENWQNRFWPDPKKFWSMKLLINLGAKIQILSKCSGYEKIIWIFARKILYWHKTFCSYMFFGAKIQIPSFIDSCMNLILLK